MRPSKFVLTAVGLPVQAVVFSAASWARIVMDARSALTETAAHGHTAAGESPEAVSRRLRS